MQILENKSISSIKRELTISVPNKEVTEATNQRLKEISGKVKIPGFRPGKVPFDEVKRRFGDEARSDALGKVIQKSYEEALKTEKLQPISYPQIKIISSNPEEDLQYTATFETYPEITIGDLSNVTATKYVLSEITDADIDEAISGLQKKHANWADVTDTEYGVKSGDKLTIDLFIKSKMDTSEKKEHDVDFELGSGFMWAEFEKPIYGHKLNDEIDFSIMFPEHHMDRDFAGKDADVRVKIKKISAPQELPLDELVTKFGYNDKGGIDAFRAYIKESLEKETKNILDETFNQEVQKKLAEFVKVETPQAFIDMEIQRRQQYMENELRRLSGMKKVPKISNEYFANVAKQTVTVGLIFAKIVEDNKITITPEALRAKVEELANSNGRNKEDSERIINWYYSNEEHLNNLRSSLVEKATLDFIHQQIKIEEIPVTYKEAIEKQAALRSAI